MLNRQEIETMAQKRLNDKIYEIELEYYPMMSELDSKKDKLSQASDDDAINELNSEIEQLEFDSAQLYQTIVDLDNERARLREQYLQDIALLHVYFKQIGIMEYARDEIYSNIDFVG